MPKKPEKQSKSRAVSDKKGLSKADRRKKNNEVGRRWYGYQSDWRKATQTLKNQRAEAKRTDTFFLEPEPKVFLITRIRGINRMSPKARQVLRLLRLRQVHNTVLIKINKATVGMLKLVEPWIAYGYPSVATIKKLICKRGYLKINRQRIPLTSNEQVEELLGEYDIKSVACMINELFTCGPNFTKVANACWPFKLSAPRGGYSGVKRVHFVDGGSYGNHEKFINQFVAKML